MNRVFISYSRQDEAFARRLATELDQAGADVWIDVDDIPAGMKWSTAIQAGLDSADGMLVVLSPDAMASSNVEDEWQYFMDHDKPVIPIWWRPTKVHFQLHRLQYIDFNTRPFDEAVLDLYAELGRKGLSLNEDTQRLLEERGAAINAQAALPVQTPAPKPKRRGAGGFVYRGRDVTAFVYGGLGMLVGIVVVVSVLFSIGNDEPFPENESRIPMIADGAEAAVEAELTWGDLYRDPLPDYRYDGAGFPLHSEPTGTSPIMDEPITEAKLPFRRYVESAGDVWYRVVHPDDETLTGWQIINFITDLAYDQSLVIPLEVKDYVEDPQEETVYAEPSVTANAREHLIDGVVYTHAFTYDDNGNLWFQIEFMPDGAPFVGWILAEDDASLALDLPMAVSLPTGDDFEISGFDYDNNNNLVDILPADDRLYVLGVVSDLTQQDKIWLSIGYVDADETWRFAYVLATSIDLNAANRGYLDLVIEQATSGS